MLANLIEKYRLVPSVKEIYADNIFYHIDRLNVFEKTVFICDENTLHIMVDYVTKHSLTFVFPQKRALPTLENACKIEDYVKAHNIIQIFAFGTGAMNDLCKYVSHKLGIRYIFIPTALSMNGIVSNNISLIENWEVKRSFIANAPTIVLLDEAILLNAPKQFIGSAIMDCLAAYTACNDFIFANKLHGQKYNYQHNIFALFHLHMCVVLGIISNNIESLYNNYNAIIVVFELLYVAGCIMNYYGSSIAFSGGEHHIAHTLEKGNGRLQTDFLHGQIISAILPYYAQLQLEYEKDNYIPQETVRQNVGNINFGHIATLLGMPNAYNNLGISHDEFHKCVQNAKHAKERPTLLSLIF